MWENIVWKGRQQTTIWRMRIACSIPKAARKRTLRICNIIQLCNNGCANVLEYCFYVQRQSCVALLQNYRGADKSLAQSGRIKANFFVRMA